MTYRRTIGAPDGGAAAPALSAAHNPPPPPQLYPQPPHYRVARGGDHLALGSGAAPAPQRGGGRRGKVRGRSKASRLKLMRKMAALDKALHPSSRSLLLTLTFGGHFPLTPEGWARDLERFRGRLERRVKRELPAAWVKEFQQGRACPHYHIAMPIPDGVSRRALLRAAREAWHGVAGDGSEANARRGFHGRVIRSWRAVRSYLGKFVARGHEFTDATTGELLPSGRSWGTWRPALLGIIYDMRTLTGRGYVRMRRAVRRLVRPATNRQKLRGRSGRGDDFATLHAFLPEVAARRLAEWANTS